MRSYRKWFITTIILITLPLLAIAGSNYCIDPLWNFDHSHRFNQIQMSFNERQQKTNHLTFNGEKYDALLLGSSRITYINQADFPHQQVYNYAVNNMLPREYPVYIDYAVKCNQREFETIYIGLDFFATNRNLTLPNRFEDPEFYINTANRFGYRYFTLISTDTLRYSWQNFNASRKGAEINFAYNRHNRKTLLSGSQEEKQQRIAQNLEWYGKEAYGINYSYESPRKILTTIKQKHPGTRIIIFTTPEAQPLFNLIIDHNLINDYERWVSDCVSVNGELYDFMTPNSITTSLDNYYDASHVYPEIGTLMAERLSGVENQTIPGDFGVRVTPENLENYLQKIRQMKKTIQNS